MTIGQFIPLYLMCGVVFSVVWHKEIVAHAQKSKRPLRCLIYSMLVNIVIYPITWIYLFYQAYRQYKKGKNDSLDNNKNKD